MLSSLLLLAGLSVSSGLGESSPGVVAQAIAQGQHRLGWESVTSFDSTDKARGSGWAFGQSFDAAILDAGGVGVLAGADYRYRDGGDWTKQTVWLRGGAIWTRRPHTVRGVVRATAWATDDTRATAVQVEYRYYAGRLVFATTQGVLWFIQPTTKAGYYSTVTCGGGW
jgi:hypothetical protein